MMTSDVYFRAVVKKGENKFRSNGREIMAETRNYCSGSSIWSRLLEFL